jgi:hypothetical protein
MMIDEIVAMLPEDKLQGSLFLGSKTLDRRLCTGRSQEAVVILTRDSRVLSCAVSSSPKL